jgi:transcriptional antiterminator RfaH
VTPLREGQPVRILHGAFADLVGLLESSRDDERVVVLLELLGREVRLRLPRAAISVAA